MAVDIADKRQARFDWVGLSGDAKPTTGAYGSSFYCTDTQLLYIYSAAGWTVKSVPVHLTAGAAAIGSVAVSSIAAGETHLGEVGGNATAIVVTPTIGAAAFTANDIVGGKLTLTSALRVSGGSGELTNLLLVDASKQNVPLNVFIFNADLAGTYADNAAEAVTAADWLKCIGAISILGADYITLANASLVSLGGIGMAVKAAAGTTLYGLIVTTGTPTYGANALQLIFGIKRN